MNDNTNPVIENVRRALGRGGGAGLAPRPEILPPREAAALDEEIDLLLKEIQALTGVARRISSCEIEAALAELVRDEKIQKASLWSTECLAALNIAGQLRALGVELIPPSADKRFLAECDLGVTEVDFALPQTGSLGLLSSPQKPRTVSLLPRVHLAILTPAAIRADLIQVFEEARRHPYLILITGPSRTADIELTVTLGVHGPQALYAWMIA